MKAVILSATGLFFKERLLAVKEYFENGNVDAVIYASDFQHGTGYVDENAYGGKIKFIHAKPYKKNISVARLTSYSNWCKKAFDLVADIKPDYIYLIVPANSILYRAAKYKKNNPSAKIIADIVDLWPESLPASNGTKKILSPFLRVWKNLRNKNIKAADAVFTECDYYKQILADQNIDTSAFKTLYLFGGDARGDIAYAPSEKLRFLYLGSINNIIDIDRIINLLVEAQKRRPVVLNIIGDGERREQFLNGLAARNIETVYHGKIYDDSYKQEVMNNCDFGLNVYKKNLAIGLTVKSIDYLRGGLPIVNTIRGDTSKMVDEYNIGVNLASDGYDAKKFDSTLYRKNALNCFEKNFTQKMFFASLNRLLALEEHA
ncbi:MAG: hypothetical protein LBP26_05760 [Clostridiales bacterium]|jgi:hypothetical protein|nr:hypothetical protein [Clostridiales bacterium]